MKNAIVRLLAVVAIPLGTATDWQNLKFKSLPANQIQFTSAGLNVKVDKSSSPLVYRLKTVTEVKGFKVEIEFLSGALNNPTDKWPEDAYLRLGFVVPGPHQLGTFERMMAADWIKQLFKLAPPGTGIDKIYFYDLSSPTKHPWQTRSIPKSKDLMLETIVQSRPPEIKTLTFQYGFSRPLSTVALWLSSDGDDSQSSFEMRIKSLILTTAD